MVSHVNLNRKVDALEIETIQAVRQHLHVPVKKETKNCVYMDQMTKFTEYFLQNQRNHQASLPLSYCQFF